MLFAAPEFWILIMACLIMCVDVFLDKSRRGIIHMLAVVALIFAAIITLRGDYHANGVWAVTAFNDTFIRDPMSDVLKLFCYATLALVYTYSKHYLRGFGLFRSDFYTLTLFALLGVMLLISANSLITVYLGLELTSLSSYALVAFDRDSKRGSESAMKYFVLGSMASGLLPAALSCGPYQRRSPSPVPAISFWCLVSYFWLPALLSNWEWHRFICGCLMFTMVRQRQ
jgi:NADH-quinone oxidoreductase subunit N